MSYKLNFIVGANAGLRELHIVRVLRLFGKRPERVILHRSGHPDREATHCDCGEIAHCESATIFFPEDLGFSSGRK